MSPRVRNQNCTQFRFRWQFFVFRRRNSAGTPKWKFRRKTRKNWIRKISVPISYPDVAHHPFWMFKPLNRDKKLSSSFWRLFPEQYFIRMLKWPKNNPSMRRTTKIMLFAAFKLIISKPWIKIRKITLCWPSNFVPIISLCINLNPIARIDQDQAVHRSVFPWSLISSGNLKIAVHI